jgi:hypothetical protein
MFDVQPCGAKLIGAVSLALNFEGHDNNILVVGENAVHIPLWATKVRFNTCVNTHAVLATSQTPPRSAIPS